MLIAELGGGPLLTVITGNTFGGTALSSYGGFWMGLAIIFIPGGFEIATAYGGETPNFYTVLAFYVSVQPSPVPVPHRRTNNVPDLRLVHLHLHGLALHPEVDRGLQLSVHDGLDRFHLSRLFIPGSQ